MEQRSVRRGERVTDLSVPLADGARLAALDARPEGAARATALLVPGFTGSKEDFLPLLPLLADAGVRVVAVDQRGQHESHHDDAPDAYTVPRLAADVVEVLDVLGGRAHLLGHSFGGLVAQAAAAAVPERLASLVLLCSGPAALPEGRRSRDARLLLDRLPGLDLEHAWQARRELDPRPEQAPEVEDFLRRRWTSTDREHYLVVARTLLEHADGVDGLARALQDAHVPVLVAHGVDDNAWPAEQQADMARRLGAAYAVVPDAAHSPAYEAPAATAELLLGHWGLLP
ncbi:pimeloyl-ACP methyl ester carboxylesterase [Motilibacter rhizosphaerae]|uniref:Pimeloyl-ACP methyl ester carboxylesterase n=1 Tax=Motilibacter rhizosphaerae TaxID=598652 RepID=A0A4Q7NPM0_9ACTN|nr:alpha/beta hydrolase [Motilibacter rhizosphaerae]RZS87219.1 pimeloyl-ACP methyl ester carboxylesterase [Motilibacter rhizosphaerae]